MNTILILSDLRKKVDSTVVYIIVSITLMFVITITIVTVVSVWQTRRPPLRSERRNSLKVTDVRAEVSENIFQVEPRGLINVYQFPLGNY
jgi:hypothetical protein